MARRRKERRDPMSTMFWAAVGLLVLGGCGLIILAVTLETSSEATKGVLSSSGEAMLVAGLLAATVDRYLKSRLAAEMAEEGALAALDTNLPPQFRDRLQDDILATVDRVYGEVTWKLNFEWDESCDRQDCLRVLMRHEVKGARNLKNDLVWLRPIWVPSSANGHSSSVTFFKFDRDTPGGDIQLDQRREVEAYARTIRGDIVIPLVLEGDRDNMWRLEPEEVYEIELQAELYRHVHDFLPLVIQAPVLSAEIRLDGEALKDLDVAVEFGRAEPLPPTRDSFDKDEMVVSYDGLLMGEQSFIVTWTRREARSQALPALAAV